MRAKFQVNTVTRFANYSGIKVEMSPVVGMEGENKEFWDATPNGRLEMTITNPSAASFLEVGKEYYLDFSKAE